MILELPQELVVKVTALLHLDGLVKLELLMGQHHATNAEIVLLR